MIYIYIYIYIYINVCVVICTYTCIYAHTHLHIGRCIQNAFKYLLKYNYIDVCRWNWLCT